jgi:hypothetical protein
MGGKKKLGLKQMERMQQKRDEGFDTLRRGFSIQRTNKRSQRFLGATGTKRRSATGLRKPQNKNIQTRFCLIRYVNVKTFSIFHRQKRE